MSVTEIISLGNLTLDGIAKIDRTKLSIKDLEDLNKREMSLHKQVAKDEEKQRKEQEKAQKLQIKIQSKEEKEIQKQLAWIKAMELTTEFARKYLHRYDFGPRTLYFARQSEKNFQLALCQPSVDGEAKELVPLYRGSDLKKVFLEYVREFDSLITDRKIWETKTNQTEKAFIARCIENIPEENTLSDFPKGLSNNKETPCLSYFDLASLVPGPTTEWDQYLKRVNHPSHLKAATYGIFVESHQGKQILNPFGGGNTAKSLLLKLIIKNLGPSAHSSVSNNELLSPFIGAKLYGKRLIYNSDCKHENMLQRSEILHQITGRDYCKMEEKYKTPFDVRMHACVIINSNNPLRIGTEDNQTLRLLPIKFEGWGDKLGDMAGTDVEWESKMEKEFPFFLHGCKEHYERLCRKSHIDITGVSFVDNIDVIYFEFEEATKSYVPYETGEVPYTELYEKVMNLLDQNKTLDTKTKQYKVIEFEKYLTSKFKAKKDINIIDGVDVLYWKGIINIKNIPIDHGVENLL